MQYTLAVDRTNERVADLFAPAHPAVLKLVRDVVRAGRRRDVPISCCGEAAGDIEFAVLLLGLGVRTLSVSPGGIPGIKRLIRSIRSTAAKDSLKRRFPSIPAPRCRCMSGIGSARSCPKRTTMSVSAATNVAATAV